MDRVTDEGPACGTAVSAHCVRAHARGGGEEAPSRSDGWDNSGQSGHRVNRQDPSHRSPATSEVTWWQLRQHSRCACVVRRLSDASSSLASSSLRCMQGVIDYGMCYSRNVVFRAVL